MIDIIGNGAIGNLLAAGLTEADHKFRLITREGAPLDLTLTRLDGRNVEFSPPVYSADQVSEIQTLFVPVKAYQVMPALNTLKAAITKDTTIVLLHNGMGTIEEVTSAFPASPLYAATTSYGAYKADAKHCSETGIGTTVIGNVSHRDKQTSELLNALLSSTLPPCEFVDDVERLLWNKLAVNAVINPLTAIFDVKNGVIAEPRFSDTVNQLCEETANVMTACGIQTSADEHKARVLAVAEATQRNWSSMHQDLTHGRMSEIDYINGHIVNKGREFGITTPTHTALLQQIKQRESERDAKPAIR